jgi:hypothetical protein
MAKVFFLCNNYIFKGVVIIHDSIPYNIKELIWNKELWGTNSASARITFEDKTTNNVLYQIENINISHDRTQFNSSATFNIVNVNPTNPKDLGYYTPYRNSPPLKPQNEWYREIIPSKRISIEMGWGGEWVKCFTGYIKRINIKQNSAGSYIEVEALDPLGYFCSQKVFHSLPVEADMYDKYYLEYPIPSGYDTAWITPGGTQPVAIEDVVKDLLYRACSYISTSDIIVEPTYLTWEGEFDFITFAQALEEMKELAQFELFCTGDGKIHFQAKQNRNTIRTGTRQLDNYDWCSQLNYQIVDDVNNIVVTDGMGFTYTKDVDYELDIFKNSIRRKFGTTTINDGQIVTITYKNCDYIFKNNINIMNAEYELNHDDIYGSIYVNGDAGENWQVITDGLLWDGSYIHIEKILEITNDLLEEETDIEKRALREMNDMLEQYMSLKLQVIGIPWLNIFDLIQCYVFGLVREIYIIDSYSLTYQNGEMLMEITAHHYAFHQLS